MKSLVSIVIPCYNSDRWVGETIQSCLDQSYRHIEVIVVDDGSTDRSRQVVLAVARNTNIAVKMIEAPHKGANTARNLGLAAAAGDYVQFLDADDLMSCAKIELQVAVAPQSPDTIPCGPWTWLRQTGAHWTKVPMTKCMNCTGDLLYQWLEGNFLPTHSFLWPRKTVVELGGWDESLSSCQDGDLFVRAALKGIKIRFVPRSIVYYRTGHARTSVSVRRDFDSLISRIRVLDKAQAALESRNNLEEYRAVLAHRHYALARAYAVAQPGEARKCFHRFLQLSPDGCVPGTLANRLATRLLGVVRKEKLSHKLGELRRGVAAVPLGRQKQIL